MSAATERKRAHLARLEQGISAKIPNSWLYPAYGGVHGFRGIGPVMLVGERPSTGTFPSAADKMLYRAFASCGAAEAHITDVIKSRGTVGSPYPQDMRLHRRFFDTELEVVGPTRIIAMGQKVYDLLQFSLADRGIPIMRIFHSPTYAGGPTCIGGLWDSCAQPWGPRRPAMTPSEIEPIAGNKKIEDAAIRFVIEQERSAGREARDTRHHDAAADIESAAARLR